MAGTDTKGEKTTRMQSDDANTMMQALIQKFTDSLELKYSIFITTKILFKPSRF